MRSVNTPPPEVLEVPQAQEALGLERLMPGRANPPLPVELGPSASGQGLGVPERVPNQVEDGNPADLAGAADLLHEPAGRAPGANHSDADAVVGARGGGGRDSQPRQKCCGRAEGGPEEPPPSGGYTSQRATASRSEVRGSRVGTNSWAT